MPRLVNNTWDDYSSGPTPIGDGIVAGGNYTNEVLINPAALTEGLPYAYHHVQGASSSVWTIEHELGFFPNVTVFDSGGSMVEGEIEHLSKNRLRATFSAPFSGNAYLS